MAIYSGAHEPIDISCREHGKYSSTPDRHINGVSGCPTCFPGGFNSSLSAFVYYLRILSPEGTLYKIGITNKNDPKYRWPLVSDRDKTVVLGAWYFDSGLDAVALEGKILELFKSDRHTGPPLLSSGNTEIFTRDVLLLDAESDQPPHWIVQEILRAPADDLS